jgi:hypothetical protein
MQSPLGGLTPESKTLWFRSLTLVERKDRLCVFTEMLLSTNPQIVEQRDAQPVEGRIRVLEMPKGPV